MTFGEFFRRAEPHKSYVCPGCGTTLVRSTSVWIMIIIAALAFGALGLTLFVRGAGVVVMAAVALLCGFGFMALVKIANYKLPLWRIKH